MKQLLKFIFIFVSFILFSCKENDNEFSDLIKEFNRQEIYFINTNNYLINKCIGNKTSSDICIVDCRDKNNFSKFQQCDDSLNIFFANTNVKEIYVDVINVSDSLSKIYEISYMRIPSFHKFGIIYFVYTPNNDTCKVERATFSSSSIKTNWRIDIDKNIP